MPAAPRDAASRFAWTMSRCAARRLARRAGRRDQHGAVIRAIPARIDWLEAFAQGDDVFSDRFGMPVVAGWVGVPEALPIAIEEARRRPEDRWGTHLFFDDDGALVGFGGFKGPPTDGAVELGYAVAPARQGRGIATAVVEQLVARAADTGVHVVVAHTLAKDRAAG